MKIYEITVTEKNVAVFHVEANNAKEAEQLFVERIDREISKTGGAYWLESAIEDGYQGYTYETTESQLPLGVPLDFNYEELTEEEE